MKSRSFRKVERLGPLKSSSDVLLQKGGQVKQKCGVITHIEVKRADFRFGNWGIINGNLDEIDDTQPISGIGYSVRHSLQIQRAEELLHCLDGALSLTISIGVE